jgi:hypothetical protein
MKAGMNTGTRSSIHNGPLHHERKVMTPEFAVDLFHDLLSQGKTHAEVEAMFTKEQIRDVICSEGDVINQLEFLKLIGTAGLEQRNDKDIDKATELWLAGWVSETPYPSQRHAVMSWYWRRPPRTKNRPGRRYLSTNQAYNAMKKQPS